MKGVFRRLDLSNYRMGNALKKSHNKFYHKFVKGKREDLIRKVDHFVNASKPVEE